MIMKINRGKGFKGVLLYILEQKKDPELIIMENVMPDNYLNDLPNPIELGSEMQYTSLENPKVTSPVWHGQISFAKEDDNLLTDELIENVSKDFINALGAENNQYIVVKHNDTAHTHLHVVINRVTPFTNKCLSIKDGLDKLFVMKLSKDLEVKYNLSKALSISRGYGVRDIKNNKFTHKPSRQTLTSTLSNFVKTAREKEFASEKELLEFLATANLKLVDVSDRESKRSYKGLQYDFTYFDRKSNSYKEDEFTCKFSSFAKDLSYSSLIKEIKSNYTNRPNKVKSQKDLLKSIHKTYDLRDRSFQQIHALLSLHDVEINKDYFKDAIEAAGLETVLISGNNSYYERHRSQLITALKLKQSLFNGTYSLDLIEHGMQFTFNKSENDLLGEKPDRFYEDYINRYGGLPNNLVSYLKNKRPNHHTINFILNQFNGESLGFNFRNVDAGIANNAFVLAAKENKKNQELNKVFAAMHVNNAYRAFKSSGSYREIEIVKYLARRGIRLHNENNKYYIEYNGIDLGLIDSFNVFSLSSDNAEALSISEKECTQIYSKEHEENKAKLYRLLDQRNIKAVNAQVKIGANFKLDEFDLKGMDMNFASKAQEIINRSALRSKGKKR